jgi:hypothetical protein
MPGGESRARTENDYGHPAQLPTSSRREYTPLGELAEGEELGSNLLRVARSNQGNPADPGHLAGG